MLRQVVFEAILENGYLGDMAIDDVRVFDGTCYNAKTLDQVRRDDEDNRRAILAAERSKVKLRAKNSKLKGDRSGSNK